MVKLVDGKRQICDLYLVRKSSGAITKTSNEFPESLRKMTRLVNQLLRSVLSRL